MRVVAWNMAHETKSWDALAAIDYDAALLTEARVPAAFDGNSLGDERTHGLDSYDRPWAAAIVSPHDLVPITDARATRRGRPLVVPFTNARPGSWEAALLKVPGQEDVTLVSVYGLMDEKSDASVHRSLSELSGLVEDERYGKRLVIGGDLNTWTGWGAGSSHLARDRNVLDRFVAYGLIDALDRMRGDEPLEGCPCSFGDDCRHTRTRIDPRKPEVPYQMDYLFVTKAMAERLDSCVALDRAAFESRSDHFPILAEFRDA